MVAEFQYDVFLSHSAKDKAVVRASSLSASNDVPRSRERERVAEGRVRDVGEKHIASDRAGVRFQSLRFAERLRADGLLNNSQPSTLNFQLSTASRLGLGAVGVRHLPVSRPAEQGAPLPSRAARRRCRVTLNFNSRCFCAT